MPKATSGLEPDRELEAARAAKEKAKGVLSAISSIAVMGIGLTRRDGVYCVKVNLAQEPAEDAELPDSIDGVPLMLHVTGAVRKKGRAKS